MRCNSLSHSLPSQIGAYSTSRIVQSSAHDCIARSRLPSVIFNPSLFFVFFFHSSPQPSPLLQHLVLPPPFLPLPISCFQWNFTLVSESSMSNVRQLLMSLCQKRYYIRYYTLKNNWPLRNQIAKWDRFLETALALAQFDMLVPTLKTF